MTRYVLVHFHLFKNAGNTVEWILEKNFGKNFSMPVYGGILGSVLLPPRTLIEYIINNPNLKAFSTHGIRFPLPKSSEVELLPMIFIRHPVDRAVSVYNFIRADKSNNSEVGLNAKRMSLKGFMYYYLFGTKRSLIKNHHIAELTDLSIRERPMQVMERVRKVPILGVLERFNESMVVAEECLKEFFGSLDFSYISQNVDPHRKDDLSDRLKAAGTEIGEDLMKSLFEMNGLDFTLYEHVNEELNSRIRKIENFDEKLCCFEERCGHLRKKQSLNYEKRTSLQYLEEQELLIAI